MLMYISRPIFQACTACISKNDSDEEDEIVVTENPIHAANV